MANENPRVIKTGLDKKYEDMLNAVVGQLSDGYWENTPRMKGYWLFAGAETQGDEAVLVISKDYARRQTRNLFLDMTDDKVKQFFADKIKFLVKAEGLKWDRGNTEETDYLSYSDPYTVKDCYFAYETLKNRNTAKHPEYSEAFYATKDGKDYQVGVELEEGDVNAPKKCTVIVNGEKETVDVSGKAEKEDIEKAIKKGIEKMGYKVNEERMSFEKFKAVALERLGADATYTDEEDLGDSIMATLDAMPYDIPEGTKEALATELFNELVGTIGESKKSEAADWGFVQINSQEDYDNYIKAADPETTTGDFLADGNYTLEDIKGGWWELNLEDAGVKVPRGKLKSAKALDKLGSQAKCIFVMGDRVFMVPGVRKYAVEYMGMDPEDYGLKRYGRDWEGRKSESSEGWDDWEEIEGLEETIERIEQLAYELRNAVRGGYTKCKTWKELSEYVKGLGAGLVDAGDSMAYMPEGDDED